ncbi:hypothetical protein ACVW0W_003123 [Bradyrhizobium sp. USDA 4469]
MERFKDFCRRMEKETQIAKVRRAELQDIRRRFAYQDYKPSPQETTTRLDNRQREVIAKASPFELKAHMPTTRE